jgi:uracil-DNA glycosylase
MKTDEVKLTNLLIKHQAKLAMCRQCPDMIPPVIIGNPTPAKILLIGQAPGDKEGKLQRPFAWTAGRTLFKWFANIGVEESSFRNHVYMSAICRCFPGKKPKGGDRVPSPKEINTCSTWLNTEIQLLEPKLIIPVGKLAITEVLNLKKQSKLIDIIGKQYTQNLHGHDVQIIPLPHPSGASTWHMTEPGKSLLQKALQMLSEHPQWKELIHKEA